jgi:hypothetical protein
VAAVPIALQKKNARMEFVAFLKCFADNRDRLFEYHSKHGFLLRFRMILCLDKRPCEGLTHHLKSLTEFPSDQIILKLKENICA